MEIHGTMCLSAKGISHTMRFKSACLAATFFLALAGCSRPAEHYAAPAGEAPAEAHSGDAIKKHLAYQHDVRIETEDAKVETIFNAVNDLCLKDTADACDVLDSHITTGTGAYASIAVRAKAEGIQKILAALAKQGNIASQSTKVDDLTEPLQDNAKKLDMLTDYRNKLEALRGRANNDIESLIKINKELAETQSQIESLNGQQAHMNQHVETQRLDVTIGTTGHQSSWQPVGEALKNFGDNISQGTASAITGLAYIVPWALVILLFASVIRFIWRRWRGPKKP